MTIQESFRTQAITCESLGSAFTARVLNTLAEVWDDTTALGHAMAAYTGDIGPAGHSLPLRIAGGLHALVRSGSDDGLCAAYPPNIHDTELSAVISNALERHEDFLLDWTRSPPQTNEVRRSAALMAMARVAAARFDLPIVLSELGASGGLNLYWDHFRLDAAGRTFGPDDGVLTLSPEWTGAPPPDVTPVIAERRGVDLNPLDPTDKADLLRLSSYLWADQPERLERTIAAAGVAEAIVDKGDAIDWLEDRLSSAPEGHLHLIQHSVAWQYFPEDAQARGKALIEAAGAASTLTRPLAWAQMETDGDTTGQVGAALTLRLWPGDVTLHLGRSDFHGRWVNWRAP